MPKRGLMPQVPMIFRISSIATCISLAAIGVCFDQPKWWKYLEDHVFDRVQLTGERRLALHLQKVTGDTEAYNQLTYYGNGAKRFTDFGLIRVEGRKVLGVVNFDMTILDSRLTDPQGQRFSIDYKRGPVTVNAGDINASMLNTNRFTTFNRTLRGVQLGYDKGRVRAKVLRSDTRGDTVSTSFPGNNSSGPYYLQSSQIVYGSEEVRVDDERMSLGKDYVISYEVGSITFIGRVIPPTSTIVVAYEVLGFNTRAGIVQGVGVSYDLGKFGSIGVSAMQQLARGGGSLSNRLEKFQGFGAPSTPYILQFEPLNIATVQIRVDGVLQRQGVDFNFDAANSSIFYFTRFMPATSNIDVVYTPKPQGAVRGDRQSLGVDYRIPLGKQGKNGQAVLSLANGRQSSPTDPLNGNAKGVDVRYRAGKWEWTGSLRDIPANYATVESRSLSRNEKAIDLGAVFHATKSLEYGFSHTNSSISSRSRSGTDDPIVTTSRFGIARLYASFRPDGSQESWNAEQRRVETRYTGQNTRLDITEIGTNRRIGSALAQLSYTRQSGFGPVRENNVLLRRNIVSNGVKAGLTYSPIRSVSLQGTASYNAIKVGNQSGDGIDLSLSASYAPSEALKLSSAYILSDSGSLNSLAGFATGYGIGYGGNGFSGGGSGSLIGASDGSIWQTLVEYRPNERLGAFARYFKSRSTGAVSSNTDSDSIGIGLTWDLHSALQFAASYDTSKTKFLDSDASSSARTFNFVASGVPMPRLSYRAGISILGNGGNSAFRQDGTIFELGLQYRLAPRHNVQLNYLHNGSSGYLAQIESGLSMTYQYRIYRSLALNVRYQFRQVKNRDPLVTTGAYRANGLDFELAFNFGN